MQPQFNNPVERHYTSSSGEYAPGVDPHSDVVHETLRFLMTLLDSKLPDQMVEKHGEQVFDVIFQRLGLFFGESLTESFLGVFSNEVQRNVAVEGFIPGLALYFVEGLNDRLERIKFKRSGENCEIIFPDASHARVFKLISYALMRGMINVRESTEKIDFYLGENVQNLDLGIQNQLPFFEKLGENPALVLLKLNILGLFSARESANGKSDIIKKFALQALSNRYKSGVKILKNPFMDIDAALDLGQQSILTDFTFAQNIQSALRARPDLTEGVEKNSELIFQAIKGSSRAVRLLNDIGNFPLTNSIENIKILLSTINPDYSSSFPLEFFNSLKGKELNNVVRAGLDRLIRDAGKDYNVLFCSGHNPELDSEESWNVFFANLGFCQNEYIKTMSTVYKQLVDIEVKLGDSLISEIIGRFLWFNFILYSFGSDYSDPGMKELFLKHPPQRWRVEMANITNLPLN